MNMQQVTILRGCTVRASVHVGSQERKMRTVVVVHIVQRAVAVCPDVHNVSGPCVKDEDI